MNKRRLARELSIHLLFGDWEYVHLIGHVCTQYAKRLARPFIFPPFLYLSESEKVSKLHPVFNKSLKTVTITSAEASTAHQ
jgi:hypothetical protein